MKRTLYGSTGGITRRFRLPRQTSTVHNYRNVDAATADRGEDTIGLSVRAWQRAVKPVRIKNAHANANDDLRSEYDLSKLTAGVKGKYYERATAGTTLVLLEPDVAEAFPDGATLNQVLRALIKVARTQVGTSATGRKESKNTAQPTSRVRRTAKSRKRPRMARS